MDVNSCQVRERQLLKTFNDKRTMQIDICLIAQYPAVSSVYIFLPPPAHQIQLDNLKIIFSLFQRVQFWRLKMNPLLKAALLRTLGFLLWASLSAWLFVIVEYTETDNRDEKYQLLLSLYEFLASKYNMSIEEFNNISNIAYEALSEPKPRWSYSDAITFVFHAWTTIGEETYDPIRMLISV